MKIETFKYFLKLAEIGNFKQAAKQSSISQPALSQAMQKLEEELGHTLIARNYTPVQLTEEGEKLYAHAKKLVHDYEAMLREMNRNDRKIEELKIGIIPTLSTYLLPLVMGDFNKRYPGVRLEIEDLTTAEILGRINKNTLDIGIMVPIYPLNQLEVEHLFYEEFLVYVKEKRGRSFILAEEINPKELWLLEEGHCLRTQVLKLCGLKKKIAHLQYKAGNIETLINLVDHFQGMTIIPELALVLNKHRLHDHVIPFKEPVPVREISLVTHKYCIKKDLAQLLASVIRSQLPRYITARKKANFVVDLEKSKTHTK